MADTIEVLLKIHKAIKDLSRESGTKLNQPFDSLNTNVAAMENMKREAKKLDEIVKSTSDHAQSFNDSLSAAAENINKGNGRLERVFFAMGEGAKLADKALGNIVSRTMDKLHRKTERARREFENISNAIAGWRMEYKTADKWYKKIFIGLDGIAAASGKILSSLAEMVPLVGKVVGSILSLGGAILSSVVSAFGTALSAATKFAKFVFTLPISIANKASEIGGQLRQELVEVIGQAVENTKEFFDLTSNGGQAFKSLGRIAKGSLLAFQSVGSTMTKLFGYGAAGAAKMVSDVTKNISDMGLFADIFAESTTKSAKSIEFVTRMTRGMGMGAEDLNYVVREAMKNGEHYFETMTRMADATESASKEFGVNRKLLSKNFFQLRKDITLFGHLSDIELTRVAARATQLGVEMKDLSGVFNKFSTFEDAANSAALLSQTFGMNIDALQLIRAESPDEIVEMFRNAMLATGRSFDDLNRHEKSLMATHTGMSVEALKTTMNYRNLGKSYEQIKQIMKDQRPEERQIRVMNSMRTSMSEIQKIMDKKDFFTAFFDGVSKTIIYNTQLGKSFLGINKQMERFYENGLSFNKTQKSGLDTILKPFADIVNEIKDIFSIENLNEAKNTAISNLVNFMTGITTTSKSEFDKHFYTTVNQYWSDKVEKMFSLESIVESNSFFGRLAMASGKIIGYILRSVAALGPGLVKGIGNAFLNVLEFIENPSNEVFSNERMAKFLGFKNLGNFKNFTASITAALKDMRSYLFGGEKDAGIFSKIYDKIRDILDIDKSSGIFVSLGQALGKGLILAIEAAGGLLELMTNKRTGTGQMAEQDRNDSLVKQGTVALQNTLKATVDQGLIQGTTQAISEGFEGAKEAIRGDYIGGQLLPDMIGGAKDSVSYMSSIDAGYGSTNMIGSTYTAMNTRAAKEAAKRAAKEAAEAAAEAASEAAAKEAAKRSIGSKVLSKLKFLGSGAKAIAKGGVLSTIFEGFNYSSENEKASEIMNKSTYAKSLSKSEQRQMLQDAANAQLKQSATTVAGGVLGGAVTGAYMGSIVPGIGTLVGGLIGAAGGFITSSLANAALGTESASEHIKRRLAERDDSLEGIVHETEISSPRFKALESKIDYINSLDGQGGRISDEDISKLYELAKEGKEEAKQTLEAIKSFFQDPSINVSVDGYALASYLTTVQRRITDNAALNNGTDTNPGARQTKTTN